MPASWIRYILLIVAVINAVLNLMGYTTISDETANDIVAVASGAYILYTGYKNQYLTKKGKRQKKVLDANNLS